MADQNQIINIMLELERRGALPENKKPIMDELRRRGVVPESRTQASPLQVAGQEIASQINPMTAVRKLQTPEAMGVGQGAIQASTMGYGMPAMRRGVEAVSTLAGRAGDTSQVRPPTTKESLVGAGLGAGLGAMAGGAGVIPQIAQKTNVLGRSAVGAGLGYAYNPSDTQNVPIGDTRRLIGAGIGGAIPLAVGATKAGMGILGGLKNATFGKGKFLNKIRGQFAEARHGEIEKYGKTIDELSDRYAKDPTKNIDLRVEINNLQAEASNNPKLQSLINRTPELKKLVQNIDKASNVTLKEAKAITNGINSKIPISKLKGSSQFRTDDLPILDLYDDIRGKQMAAFPELAELNKSYGEIMNAYKVFKPSLKIGSLEPSLLKKPNFEQTQELKKLVPEKLRNEMTTYRRLSNAPKATMKTIPYITTLGALGYMTSRLAGKK